MRLKEQLDNSPSELPALVAHVAGRCLGDKAEREFVDGLTQSTLSWIERSPEMGPGSDWPGNFRELEQCVRSVMARGEYHPPARRRAPSPQNGTEQAAGSTSELDRFAADVRAGNLSFDDLLTKYCSLVFSRTSNIAETARRLKKHRLTVQGRIDSTWVQRFRGG